MRPSGHRSARILDGAMYESESKTMATYGSSLLSLLLFVLEGNGIVELETSYKRENKNLTELTKCRCHPQMREYCSLAGCQYSVL